MAARKAVRSTANALRWVVYGLTSLIGVVAFLYPFFIPSLTSSGGLAHAVDSPLFLGLLGGFSLVALLLEAQGEATSDAKRTALLGVLVGLNAVLGFLETAIPGPGGFSPTFFLIILGGYVYGGRFGFLLGSLTLFVSALITGGIGPWLPYRMLVAGWIGLGAPLVLALSRAFHAQGTRWELVLLAGYGAVWGLAFGALMDLWFWPFAIGPDTQHWQPGVGLGETLQRFLAFYIATSLIWDAMRAVGTVAMILLFGAPTVRTLRRFARRFFFTVAAGPAAYVAGERAAASGTATREARG
ncbi:MAG: ECF transporter S component [Anaerolineae bacterium]|jgi:energy-coupling factor transport system substrate-specific component|nr:ECF transporter S component [Anaerolineae bacterium]